jgi:hypothetical protein
MILIGLLLKQEKELDGEAKGKAVKTTMLSKAKYSELPDGSKPIKIRNTP